MVDVGGGRRKRRREQAIAGLLGLIVTLTALELTLRAVSVVFWRPVESAGGHQDQPVPLEEVACAHCFRILCVGDSFTYGIGAPPGASYPDQLARMLEAANRGDVVVINGGQGGFSTTDVLASLKRRLDALPVNLVVIMAGNSNLLNLPGYLQHVYQDRFAATIARSLFRLRTVRYGWYMATALASPNRDSSPSSWPGFDPRVSLARVLAWKAARNPGSPVPASGRSSALAWFEAGVRAVEAGDVEEAVRVFKRGVEVDPGEGANYYGMGVANQLYGRCRDGAGWFRAGLRESPGDATLYGGLGELLIEQASPWDPIVPVQAGGRPFMESEVHVRDAGSDSVVAEAMKVLEHGMAVDPSYPGNFCALGTLRALMYDHRGALPLLQEGVALDPQDPRCYPALVAVARMMSRREEAIQFLSRHGEASSVARRFAEGLRAERDDYAAWIRADLEEMAAECGARGVPFVFMEYPLNTTVNAVMRAVAGEEGAVLVENERVFRTLLAGGTPFEALFSPDGHCNEHGYAILAERLYAALVHERLLPGGGGEGRAAPMDSRDRR